MSPGGMAKENRRRYVQIRRGDSRKGLERIGRCVSQSAVNCCLLFVVVIVIAGLSVIFMRMLCTTVSDAYCLAIVVLS